MSTEDALVEIADERRRQSESGWSKSHDRGHNDAEWTMLVGIYNGKLHDAILNSGEPREVLRRFTQIGALCVAAIESLSEQKGYQL